MSALAHVKICGLTRAVDAEAAVAAGVWALGVVLSASGPRAIGLERAAEVLSVAPAETERVGVFVSPSPERVAAATARLPLTRIQVHGELHRDVAAAGGLPLIRARAFASEAELLAIDPLPDELTLLDSAGPGGAGGTGERLEWETLARSMPPWPFVLAGGLTSENVAAAVALTRPFAVDVSSGVEAAPGIKDHARVRRFVQNAAGAREPA